MATLVAISPELQDVSQDTITRNGLRFEVLSDSGNRVACEYGLDFVLDASLRPIYKAWGADVALRNGDDTYRLPMPATFVVQVSPAATGMALVSVPVEIISSAAIGGL